MLILDGSFADELVRAQGQGSLSEDPLWSARAISNAPQAVKKVHANYLDAGADIILTSTYQAAPGNLMEHLGLTRTQADELLKRGLQMAVDAVAEWKAGPGAQSRKSPQIALSLGTLGAILADGSEFTGRFASTTHSHEDMVAFHVDRLAAFGLPYLQRADWLAFETVPALGEVRAILEALRQYEQAQGCGCELGKAGGTLPPTWISVSCCDEGHTNAGDTIEDVTRLICEVPMLQTVGASRPRVILGINCTHPRFIGPLLARIRCVAPELPVVIYPNRGEQWDAVKRDWIPGTAMSDADFAALAVNEWSKYGVYAIGGCCRTGPSTTQSLRSNFD